MGLAFVCFDIELFNGGRCCYYWIITDCVFISVFHRVDGWRIISDGDCWIVQSF
jgi:hypothetical protein